jgi:hypothetical protein
MKVLGFTLSFLILFSLFSCGSGSKEDAVQDQETNGTLQDIANQDTSEKDSAVPDQGNDSVSDAVNDSTAVDIAVDTKDAADSVSETAEQFKCPEGVCAPSSKALKKPGQDCNKCHSFRFAGTVYPPASIGTCGDQNQGVLGVKISAIPEGSETGILIGTANCVGNFLYQGSDSFGGKNYNFHVEFTNKHGDVFKQTMSGAKKVDDSSKFSCNSCHNPNGSAKVPVHL